MANIFVENVLSDVAVIRATQLSSDTGKHHNIGMPQSEGVRSPVELSADGYVGIYREEPFDDDTEIEQYWR